MGRGGMGRGKQDPNFSIIYFNVKRKVKGLQSCKENKNICQEYFKWLLLLNYKYNSEILLIMKKFRIYTQTPPGKTNDLVITYNKPKHKGKLKGWEQSVCVRSFAVMLTSFDPMGCSPSGSSVCGMFQAAAGLPFHVAYLTIANVSSLSPFMSKEIHLTTWIFFFLRTVTNDYEIPTPVLCNDGYPLESPWKHFKNCMPRSHSQKL